jgi:endonuclease/exonuclease/phosphatase family metal-dependent hydrolase
MMDRVEILVGRLRHAFSRSRWSGRFAGQRSVGKQHARPGIVLVQIDGLGERILHQALSRGQMPFLGRLIRREGHQIISLYSGLPSATPAFQAELFFGQRCAVPAFCFRDPELGRTLSMNDPRAASVIEARLKACGSGLLRGGSAWSNIFSGGAAEAHLTASDFGVRSARLALSPTRWVALSLWHVWSAFRAIGNLFLVSVLAVVDLVRGRHSPREFFSELRFVPLRVLVSVVMREIVAIGSTIDLHRGLPVVQLNLLGYDEHAHRRGPDSRFAMWSLRGIDKVIHRVWLAARASRRRDYLIWVYSDHGQEKVIPFDQVHGESVPRVVERIYESMHEEGSPAPARSETNLDPPSGNGSARAPWLSSKFLEKPLLEDDHEPHLAGATRISRPEGSIVVTHQGPAGSIYLPRDHSPQFLEEFAEKLVREGKIPMAIRPLANDGAVAWTADGTFRLPQQGAELLGENHPHLHETAKDLVALAHHDGSGDVLIFGWNREQPLSLQNERGSHGGPGPEETSAFVVVPAEAHAFAALPRVMRPGTLRSVLLRAMGRWPGEGAEESAPQYHVPRLARKGLSASVRLRVMTYNVHGCRGSDGIFAPHRIARVIARERPDLVCLQELDQERLRSGGVDQVHQIAQRLQREYLFHAVSELDDGNFGNAILSALPMRLHKAAPLPSSGETTKNMLNLWPRGALWAVAQIEGREVHIINTHLSILPAERHLQVEALLGPEWLRSPDCRGPIVLAGDFNAGPSSRTMQRLQEALVSAIPEQWSGRPLRTWTGAVPLRRIDHILMSPSVTMNGVHVPRTAVSRVASDHAPLVVDLTVSFADLPDLERELTLEPRYGR